MSASRRHFLGATAAVAATAALPRVARAANDEIVVGVMGVNGRGSALTKVFAQQPNCRVAYVCDVDERAIAKGKAAATSVGGAMPEGVADFRRIRDDKGVDAMVIATPDHWHAPATILACDAGKHVYVEKPCCHNPREGELALAAARKNNCVVTQGTQRRSWPAIMEAIKLVRTGKIGDVRYSRSWYNNRRGSIGQGKKIATPDWLDFKLWQGPAPAQPYQDNLVHYNWHWFWNWGTGEIGNNGVHSIDISRWGLGVDYPSKVSSGGGRFRFDDDQQTPDTHNVVFDFDGKSIAWQGLSWSPRGSENSSFGISFHGDEGTLVINGAGYVIYDMKNKEISKEAGSGGDSTHVGNFLASIRAEKRPNADIEEAYKSTLLCHLGNIAHRTGRTLHTDATNGHIRNDENAMKLWSRDYQPEWKPDAV